MTGRHVDPAGRRDLRDAYDHCRLITRTHARNFYYAFLTLPAAKRRAIYAAYAFCRLCDDIADSEMPATRRRELFADTRRRLRGLLDADEAPPHPIFDALADTARRYRIPVGYFEEILEGVEMDMTQSRFGSFDELRTYCYKVASVVGLVCIEIFEYDDARARDYAIALGIGMQLTNIIRDVREDAEMGRIYIPADEMAAHGYSEEELVRGVANEPFLRLMRFQAERAREHLREGRRLLPLLSGRSRACPAVLHDIYAAVLDRIEGGGFRVFDGRIGLSTREKLLIMGRTWTRSMLPLPARAP
ncbi:MAG: phytoene/squalene synthase family protein [Chloroflexi bacterium]|nr:phytoene/squalene synthase family protein [Chloroflexota bacterium]